MGLRRCTVWVVVLHSHLCFTLSEQTQTAQRVFFADPANRPTTPITAHEGFCGLCSAPMGVARSSSYASTRMTNAVLVPMPRLSNGACFARYVGVVPWGVSGGAAHSVRGAWMEGTRCSRYGLRGLIATGTDVLTRTRGNTGCANGSASILVPRAFLWWLRAMQCAATHYMALSRSPLNLIPR